jgi:hypothetical protein
MLPEATLFGILLLLAIALTLIFLLTRRPRLGFHRILASQTKMRRKTSEDKEVAKTPRAKPQHLEQLAKSPASLGIRQDRRVLPEGIKRQVESNTNPAPPNEEKNPAKFTSAGQSLDPPKKPAGLADSTGVAPERPMSTPARRPQLRPASCTHFFGYLRKIPKNVVMPDECFGCPKMMECLYYNPLPE